MNTSFSFLIVAFETSPLAWRYLCQFKATAITLEEIKNEAEVLQNWSSSDFGLSSVNQ